MIILALKRIFSQMNDRVFLKVLCTTIVVILMVSIGVQYIPSPINISIEKSFSIPNNPIIDENDLMGLFGIEKTDTEKNTNHVFTIFDAWIHQILHTEQKGIVSWDVFKIWASSIPIVLFLAIFFSNTIAGSVEKKHYHRWKNASPNWVQWQKGMSMFTCILMIDISSILFGFIDTSLSIIVMFIGYTYCLSYGFFMIISLRHMDQYDARRIWSQKRPKLLIGGMIMTTILVLPTNILFPIIAPAIMTHLFPEKTPTNLDVEIP